MHFQREPRESQPTSSCFFVVAAFVVICAVCCVLFVHYDLVPISLNGLKTELSTKILSQDSAVETLYQSFKQLGKPGKTRIITALVGSSGVGKTFAINIIKKHVDSKAIHCFERENLLDLISNSFSHLRNKLYIQPSEYYNIIVFDNLITSDLEQLILFIEKIEDFNILILPIFNIQSADENLHFTINYNDVSVIREKLENRFNNFRLAQFGELNEAVVKLWLRNELKFRVNKYRQEEIIEELMSGQNIKYHGLKGLHPKLLIELDKVR